jgi:pyrimidine-specific ribonucleoside hydrolase
MKLLIDTDVALGVWHEDRPRDIDDGFAIVEAINLDAIQLVGVTTVFGNAPLADTHRVANEILALKHTKVPALAGAAEPLPQDGAIPPPNDAVRFMAEALSSPGTSIAAIGPLTNLGLLAHHYPDALANAEQIVVVAGRTPGRDFYIGGEGPVRDFNFENDVRATELLLGEATNIVLAGFELTSQVVVTEMDLGTIAARGTDTAAYFHRNSLDWCRHCSRTFPTEAGFHPWDSAAIAWCVHPRWFVAEDRSWQISAEPPRLECPANAEGKPVTYLTGFAPGGKAAFVESIVNAVY